MINTKFFYSKDLDRERVLDAISRWNYFKQYYNVDWIKLPIKLDKERISDYSETEIADSIEEEYPNNLNKIYEKVKREILSDWEKVSQKIESVSQETNVKFPSELEIYLTCYGMGGSYYLPNKITLLAIKFNLVETIVHELIHLAIEDKIQKFKVDQPQKERIVDLFMSKYFGDIFPNRLIPAFSQQVYQKIDYKKIDEIFEKFEPDMEAVIEKVSEIKNAEVL